MSTINQIIFTPDNLEQIFFSRTHPCFIIQRISKIYSGQWDGRFSGHIAIRISGFDGQHKWLETRGDLQNLYLPNLQQAQPIMEPHTRWFFDFNHFDEIEAYQVRFKLEFMELKENESLVLNLADSTLEYPVMSEIEFVKNSFLIDLPNISQPLEPKGKDAEARPGIVLTCRGISRSEGEMRTEFWINSYLQHTDNVWQALLDQELDFGYAIYTDTQAEAKKIFDNLYRLKNLRNGNN